MQIHEFSLIKTAVFAVISIFSFALLYSNLRKVIRSIRIAKDEDRTNRIFHRIAKTFRIAILQEKILRKEEAGTIHVFIFWGFLLLLFSAAEALIQGFIPHFSLNILGYFYSFISFSTDIFIILILLSLITAAARRNFIKIPRLQGDSKEKRDAAIILTSIFIIVASLAVCIASAETLAHSEYSAHFLQYLLAGMININPTLFYEISWWVHIVAIFSLMNYLPFSKHLHVYFAIPNVFFSDDSHVALKNIDFKDETNEKFGATEIKDLSWKNLFDGYSCTHCGRCDEVCPANSAGMTLKPRDLMMSIRKNAEIHTNEISNNQEISESPFIDTFFPKESLWECTTCAACMNECPVNNEHVPAIIEFRRGKVMMESDFPPQLQTVFENLESYGSPWAVGEDKRLDWATGTNVKHINDNPDPEILFWVGCAGAFDEKAARTSRAIIKILETAGINYAVLGEQERCNGDIARRSGNEYLADMLITSNIETLKLHNIRKILTTCPHCYNTFKNEYPNFGYRLEVVHHTELINQLIESGKLSINKELLSNNKETETKYTYHDSCYLGRYNNIYEAPRKVLEKSEIYVTEAKRNRSNGLCCGGGGGGIFIDNSSKDKINDMRTRELLETSCDVVASNCPFCQIMLSDSLKSLGHPEVEVKDIAEIVAEKIESSH